MAMNAEQLHVVLQQSFSPDAALRGPAEETIRNLKHIKGATIMLLQVAAEKQVSFGGKWRTLIVIIVTTICSSPYVSPNIYDRVVSC